MLSFEPLFGDPLVKKETPPTAAVSKELYNPYIPLPSRVELILTTTDVWTARNDNHAQPCDTKLFPVLEQLKTQLFQYYPGISLRKSHNKTISGKRIMMNTRHGWLYWRVTTPEGKKKFIKFRYLNWQQQRDVATAWRR